MTRRGIIGLTTQYKDGRVKVYDSCFNFLGHCHPQFVRCLYAYACIDQLFPSVHCDANHAANWGYRLWPFRCWNSFSGCCRTLLQLEAGGVEKARGGVLQHGDIYFVSNYHVRKEEQTETYYCNTRILCAHYQQSTIQ